VDGGMTAGYLQREHSPQAGNLGREPARGSNYSAQAATLVAA